MISSPPRSYLFVPGNRHDRFAKAYDSGAHGVILDLEDSVSPSEKSAARSSIAAWLSAERPVFLRVNGADTEWFREDMRLCELPGVAGVVLPKAQSSEQIRALSAIASDSLTILPLIETAEDFGMLFRLPEHVMCNGFFLAPSIFGRISAFRMKSCCFSVLSLFSFLESPGLRRP